MPSVAACAALRSMLRSRCSSKGVSAASPNSGGGAAFSRRLGAALGDAVPAAAAAVARSAAAAAAVARSAARSVGVLRGGGGTPACAEAAAAADTFIAGGRYGAYTPERGSCPTGRSGAARTSSGTAALGAGATVLCRCAGEASPVEEQRRYAGVRFETSHSEGARTRCWVIAVAERRHCRCCAWGVSVRTGLPVAWRRRVVVVVAVAVGRLASSLVRSSAALCTAVIVLHPLGHEGAHLRLVLHDVALVGDGLRGRAHHLVLNALPLRGPWLERQACAPRHCARARSQSAR